MSDPRSIPNPTIVAKSAREWWRYLHPDDNSGDKGDRAALARLRRAGSPVEAMSEEATFDLFRRIGLGPTDVHRLPRVAVIAMVLAHVRNDAAAEGEGRPPAAIRSVGRKTPEDKDSAKMKPLRLRRLLACRDDEELAREMRRFVALADGTLNVGDLAASLFFWGDRVRARWAFEYYAAGAAAPREEVASTD